MLINGITLCKIPSFNKWVYLFFIFFGLILYSKYNRQVGFGSATPQISSGAGYITQGQQLPILPSDSSCLYYTHNPIAWKQVQVNNTLTTFLPLKNSFCGMYNEYSLKQGAFCPMYCIFDKSLQTYSTVSLPLILYKYFLIILVLKVRQNSEYSFST